MTWENAFGGAVLQPTRVHKNAAGEDAILPEHPETFPDNFDGKDFYTEAGGAAGELLPQIEDPDHLIEHWDDRPEPVCFAPCPMHSGLRARFVLRDGAVDFGRH